MLQKFFSHFFRLVRRPVYLYDVLREKFLFVLTFYLLQLPGVKNLKIVIHRNARIQSLSCLMAEKPNASIVLGKYCIVYEDAKIAAYDHGRITIGAHSIIGRAQIFSKNRISIGTHVITSWNVFLQDYDPHPIDPIMRKRQIEYMTRSFRPGFDIDEFNSSKILELSSELKKWRFESAPIIIGDNVWIGANTTILKGVEIGSGCVIAAHSVVTAGVYPANSLIAGVPAKVIKAI